LRSNQHVPVRTVRWHGRRLDGADHLLWSYRATLCMATAWYTCTYCTKWYHGTRTMVPMVLEYLHLCTYVRTMVRYVPWYVPLVHVYKYNIISTRVRTYKYNIISKTTMVHVYQLVRPLLVLWYSSTNGTRVPCTYVPCSGAGGAISVTTAGTSRREAESGNVLLATGSAERSSSGRVDIRTGDSDRVVRT
jgi:hypothetical protein